MKVGIGIAPIGKNVDSAWRGVGAAIRSDEVPRGGAYVFELSHELGGSDGVKCVVMWADESVGMFGDGIDCGVGDTNVLVVLFLVTAVTV